jgi:L-malate glycosyltransferase
MRLVLIGDGQSPHLLKWARALARFDEVELWAASSRGFMAGFDAQVHESRRLALNTQPDSAGGNVALLRKLPQLASWLKRIEPDWLHAHYLTSHGTLAWLAQRVFGVAGRTVGSAWGSDILVTPERSAAQRWLTRRVLGHCALATSDSQVMARRMQELGAREVMVFPFGLEAMPPLPAAKDSNLYFSNRALEPVYAPQRVLALFAQIAARQPEARLVVANEGSLHAELQAWCTQQGLRDRIRFTGRLDAATQAQWYAQALWYISLPLSDSVAVSVLEAMAHGCIPLLSDLPANRELVRHGDNGMIVGEGGAPEETEMNGFVARAEGIAAQNRAWIEQHALFEPAVQRFVARLRELS